MNQNIEGKYFLTTPSNSLKIVKQQKNMRRGSLKNEKNESFINDSLNWKKIFDLKIALHGLKRKLVFLTIYQTPSTSPGCPDLSHPFKGDTRGGRNNHPTWPPPSWPKSPPLWSCRGKGVYQGVSYSKRVAYYIHLAAAPNPWVGSPGKCGPMVG